MPDPSDDALPTVPLTDLARILAAGDQLHRLLEGQVHAQRLAGASWSAIAAQLGVSKQSAHERWKYLDGPGYGDRLLKRARTPLGTWQGYYGSPLTAAAFGPEQIEQVREHGAITSHHPRLAIA